MRAAIAISLALLVGGCEAIDNFNPFHIVGGDVGGARDLAAVPSDLIGTAAADLGAADFAADLSDDAAPAADGAAPDLPLSDLLSLDLGPCGPCLPGATQAGGCDPCSQQTCGNNCQWSGCTLKPGNACENQKGANTRPCPNQGCIPSAPGVGWECASPPYQTCLNCQWDQQCYCPCHNRQTGANSGCDCN